MWEEILRLAASNGLWAVLFCALLVHILRDSKKREERYSTIIHSLAEKLNIIEQIKENTDKILKQTARQSRKKPTATLQLSASELKEALG